MIDNASIIAELLNPHRVSISVRTQLAFTDTMAKYHGDMERILYAAEIHCKMRNGKTCSAIRKTKCAFRKEMDLFPDLCTVVLMRELFGDVVEQHNI